MAIKKENRRVLILLVIAIFITLYLIINSIQFRTAGLVFLAMGIFAMVGYQRGGLL